MDTPPWVVKFVLRQPGHRAFSLAVLRFCGIRPVRVRMLGPVKPSTPAMRRKWLELAADEAELVKTGRLRGIEAAFDRFAIWLKALRLQFYPMTWVAYTAGASWIVPLPQLLSNATFWWGYALLFFIEVMTVFLNEIHDYKSDRANPHYGPFNGGSRVLVDGLLTSAQLKRGVAVAGAGAFGSLLFLLAHSPAPFPAVTGLALLALALGVAYTVPPAKLCHRGAGETVVAFTHSLMIVQCGVLFLGGPLAGAPVWIIGLPLFFAVFAAITLSGIPDRTADQAAGKLTLAVRFGTGAAFLIAIVSAAVAMLSALVLRVADAPGGWPVPAICGMAAHGLLLIGCLERKRRSHRRTHIDGLMALALSFIMWFAVAPFFARSDRTADPAGDHGAGRAGINGDLIAVNQSGETVRISDLRGKVWAVTEFFIVCPLCARSSFTDLRALSEKFAGNPDFHLVCISIDPERDDVEKLDAYARALGAESHNWWLLTGDRDAIHRFLEDQLKFPPVVERTEPDDIAAMGRFQHDLGILIVDRKMRIVGKRNLSWAAEQSADLHAQWKRHLHRILENELAGGLPRP